MRPWTVVDHARAPDGGGELRLLRRGEEYSIQLVGSGELMGSRAHGSEEALAELAGEAWGSQPIRSALVGGLGMGFTAAAMLRVLSVDSALVVVELVDAVVAWNREHLGHLAGHPLQDSRVRVVVDDVYSVISESQAAFDAIVLDVDNGPDGLVRESNDRLYSARGLEVCRQALTKTGVLAVWSAHPAPTFHRRMESAGFTVQVEQVRGHRRKKGPRHTIYIARK